MHLGIEATKMLGERRGIGRYVRNLLRQFVLQRPAMRCHASACAKLVLEPKLSAPAVISVASNLD